MKLLWQQIIGVMAVLMVALGLSAYLTSRYMSNRIFQDKQEELIQYGTNIVANHFTRNDLERASQLLQDKEIVIQVYLDRKSVV